MGGGLRETCKKTFPLAKSICESSLKTHRKIEREIQLVWCTIDFAEQLKCLCISKHVQFLHFRLEKRNYQMQILGLESNNSRNGV